MQNEIKISLMATRQVIEDMLADTSLQNELARAVDTCVCALRSGGKLMFAGNGGSAAEAQHLSAEMVGRFLKERRPLPSIALSTDTSALTAIGNDYGYDEVFARQVEALVRSGDVVVGISTSGNSKNVVKALLRAKEQGALILGMTGNNVGEINKITEKTIAIPSTVTARIQEGHILAGHIICQYIDEVGTSA